MKKLLSLGLVTLCGITLAACSSGDSEVKVSSNSTSTAVTASETASSSTAEESAVGKRSNPVPLGSTATFDTTYYAEDGTEINSNISMTISNPLRGQEAYDFLLSENEYNEAAPEGKEWLVFDVKMKMNKGSQDEPYYAMPSFTPISSNGEEVAQDTYGTFSEGSEFGYKELYEGGELSGKVALLVPTGDDTLISFTDFNSKVFFSLK